MSRKAPSPMSPAIASLRARGARVGHGPSHYPTSTLKPWLDYVITMPSGRRYVLSGPGWEYQRIIAGLNSLASRIDNREDTP